MTDDVAARRSTALQAARAGGQRALEDFRQDIAIETKDGLTDHVTAADRAAQDAVHDAIREEFPEDPIVGEEDETPSRVPEEGPAWIVDPIDGTTNFVRDIPIFATAVAALVDGEPVAAAVVLPALEDEYVAGDDGARKNGDQISVSKTSRATEATICPTLWWPRDRRDEFGAIGSAAVQQFSDTRRFGCAQYELSLVAEGGLDATVANVRGNPWDTVAGSHIVRQAGGSVTDLEGEHWRHDSVGLVASNGAVHEAASTVASAAADTERSEE